MERRSLVSSSKLEETESVSDDRFKPVALDLKRDEIPLPPRQQQ